MHPDLAWAAGFYEGEGSISHVRGALQLVAVQVDPEPLDDFRLVFKAGTIGPPRQSDGLRTFRCSGLVAQRVAMAMWPRLSRRRQDQILTALRGYVFRRVRDPLRCQRGHPYSATGAYISPDGGRECARCRNDRRAGRPLPPRSLPRAIELGVGIRQYSPPPIREDQYQPTRET
jgi:hypothetical protein